MNARTNPAPAALSTSPRRLLRASGVAVASLLLSTSAFADTLETPDLQDLRVYGADCVHAVDFDGELLPSDDMPNVERVCDMGSSATVTWGSVDGAASYLLTVWGDYGQGFEYVSQYTADEPKIPVTAGNAEAYAFTLQTAGPGGDLSDATEAIVLRIDAVANSGAPDDKPTAPPADGSTTPPQDPGASQPDADKIAELEADLDAAYDDIHDAFDTIERLEKRVIILEAALSNANDKLIDQNKDVAQLKAQNEALRQALHDILGGADK